MAGILSGLLMYGVELGLRLTMVDLDDFNLLGQRNIRDMLLANPPPGSWRPHGAGGKTSGRRLFNPCSNPVSGTGSFL